MGVLLTAGGIVLAALGAAVYFYRQCAAARDAQAKAEADRNTARLQLSSEQADRQALGAALAQVQKDAKELRQRYLAELHVVWSLLFDERARNAGETSANHAAVLADLDSMLSGQPATSARSSAGPVQPVREGSQPAGAASSTDTPAVSGNPGGG